MMILTHDRKEFVTADLDNVTFSSLEFTKDSSLQLIARV